MDYGGDLLVISPVAPQPVRALLALALRSDAGTLAVKMVHAQLAGHETRRRWRARTDTAGGGRLPSLFDVAAERLARFVGEDAEVDIQSMEGLPPSVLSRIALRLENMPYDVFCRVRHAAGEREEDVDEWVLRNEVWLREGVTPASDARQRGASAKHFRPDGEASVVQRMPTSDSWASGLVGLSTHADAVFPGSTLTETCRTITRPTSLPGFKILDGRRPPAIRIQPSVERYRKTFEAMTGGLLKGLNWDNILVAGGLALGALLCIDDEETTSTRAQWESSDIDLYIHGLGPVAANKKVEHIFSVFKANLGGDVPLVVRNSRTITFYPAYPLRRIQVVLKLSSSPKDVILNFDLDVCAVGWDGEEVWMLPRAARALETGYTVFTMDLINGHYLGDRHATQEQRVFKYADKGFGIRILPSYLEERQIIVDDPAKLKEFHIRNRARWDRRSFDEIVEGAREWTATVVKGIAKVDGDPVPTIAHSALQESHQKTDDPPRRSVLSGFGLFMRHVALWEHELAGGVIIKKNNWAAQLYDNIYSSRFGISYDDAPDYPWDEGFTADGFIDSLNHFNQYEHKQLISTLGQLVSRSRVRKPWPPPDVATYLAKGCVIQRITHAYSAAEILQPECDICLPVRLPKVFLEFADALVPERVRKTGAVPDYATKTFTSALADDVPAYLKEEDEGLRLVMWRITNITMWQQWDRAIDEVHEALWTFHLVNAGLDLTGRMEFLAAQLARGAIRMTEQDERAAFARWVARTPESCANPDNPYYEFLSRAPVGEEGSDSESDSEPE